MRKMLDGNEAMERIRDFFTRRPDIKLAIVYGSAARNRLAAHSDIDIAVGGIGVIDPDNLMDLAAGLSAELGREIDLVDLRRVEGLLLHRIMTNGKRVKTDPALFVKFLMKAYGYREDFKPLQDMIRAERIGRFVNGSGNR